MSIHTHTHRGEEPDGDYTYIDIPRGVKGVPLHVRAVSPSAHPLYSLHAAPANIYKPRMK